MSSTKTTKDSSAPSLTKQGLEPLDGRAVFLLSQIGHQIATLFGERLEPLNVQPRHFAVMNGLASNDGATQQQLADELGIHRNIMVGIVDDLERNGFAKREPHPLDRRAHSVRLTGRGRSTLKAAHAAADSLESELAKFVTISERTQFIDSLQRVATGLRLQPGAHPSLRETR